MGGSAGGESQIRAVGEREEKRAWVDVAAQIVVQLIMIMMSSWSSSTTTNDERRPTTICEHGASQALYYHIVHYDNTTLLGNLTAYNAAKSAICA